ncbi:MAG: cob(I)yrinic acid a,c-diamide adenosyltransferase [Myxococcales bacterium]|nr:cob(I)yrinic acid a,c-diamide adenosyltransferase [Myxococcales bacterium]
MKIYTKTGDGGDTGLFGGARVSKADPRVDAYGDVDEANSALGMAAEAVCQELRAELQRIQGELLCVGAELSSNPNKPLQTGLPLVDSAAIGRLEASIDRHEAELPPLTSFILPGGSRGGAALHLARAVMRRAERKVVCLANDAPIRPELLRYLNRLSDLLFVLARSQNQREGAPEIAWAGRSESDGS